MKTILFPTDFSENATKALSYAVDIADKCDAKIILFNAFWVPLYQSDTPAEIKSKEKSFRNESLKELQKLEKRIHALYPDLSLEILISNGFTCDEIVETAAENQVDLIVMGTKGATGLKEVIMGSNTVDVINKSCCPVLVIPETARDAQFRKIVFASNFSENDTEEIEFLIELGKLFEAEITIAHVTEEDYIIETADKAILEHLKRDVKRKTHYPNLKHKLLKGEVIEELHKFIKKNDVDLLAMVTSQKYFLSKIFNKSFTHKMAFHSEVPLLVMHSKEK